MKRSNRLAWLGAIALGVMIILTLFAGPTGSKINSGSTYSRTPDGYGAWYSFMQQQRTSIQRWQKPFNNLNLEKRPIVLIQVTSCLRKPTLDSEEQAWVKAGNMLVLLGVQEQVSAANFSTQEKSLAGDVKIDTKRRFVGKGEVSLGDRFGAVVWEQQYGKGKVIFSTTPYLAANAYQDNLSNFQYLSSLVRKKDDLILVDEYIHGYKDPSVRKSEGKGDLFDYLTQTPLFPALLQAGVLLLVLIWGENCRFGKPVALDTTPVIENSEAYIQALAGVLQKAESSDFVIEVVGKEEKRQLQKALGFGQELLDDQTLIDAWEQQIGDRPSELKAALKLQSQKRRLNEKDLINWLRKWQNIRRH
ncbi:MAG: DUF4350 domain-containing protein [Rhizonema sp. NSF051]|nr:DUF4350 domain-containing protein [Rhizonema sp. NSF051]